MKKGYVLVHVDVRDPDAYQEYVKRTPPVVAQYGGRFIIRGPRVERREGEIDWKRVVVLEFPSLDRARAWYDSPEYQAIIGLRHVASTADLIILEGFEDA